ncbi:hypothetical protein [Azospirillum melinis]
MHFAVLPAAPDVTLNPHRPQVRRYSLGHLLLFSVRAVLAGATAYQRIITVMTVHRQRPNGARYRRAPAVTMLRNLSVPPGPDALDGGFRHHARLRNGATAPTSTRTIALDGNTLRGGSFDHRRDRTTAHVFSTFPSDAALSLGHRDAAAAAAPEEVGGVQALSADLAGGGVLVTADALHCQNAPAPKPPPPATPCWCMSMTVLTPICLGMIGSSGGFLPMPPMGLMVSAVVSGCQSVSSGYGTMRPRASVRDDDAT